MRKPIVLLSTLCVVLLIHGCKYKKLRIHSEIEGSEFVINGEVYTDMPTKFRYRNIPLLVENRKEGYLSKEILIYPEMRVPKNVKFGELMKIPEQDSIGIYYYVDNANIDWADGRLDMNVYRDKLAFRFRNPGSNEMISNREIPLGDMPYVPDYLNNMLAEHGLADESVFIGSFYRSVFLDCNIHHGTIDYWVGRILWTELQAEWTIKDMYRDTILSLTVPGESRYFEIPDFHGAVVDGLEKSLITFLSSDTVIQALEAMDVNSYVDQSSWEPIELDKSTTAQSLEDAVKAVVTVVAGHGHGSGCVISNDGYVVTNFHVAGAAPDVSVKIGNNYYDAEVVRNNAKYDLTLLKVDRYFHQCLEIGSIDPDTVGASVYAIGTPLDIELEQTVTRGGVNGLNPIGGIDYLESRISVNPGNSGGALVDSDGMLIGVVNAKIVPKEGDHLGLAIPSFHLFDELLLQYPKE